MITTGLVYLIQAGDLYKIGRTQNLLSRMRQIGTDLKMSVRLIHGWHTSQHRSIEGYLQSMMAGYRITGEWFRLGEPELQRLRLVKFVGLRALTTSHIASIGTKEHSAAHILRYLLQARGIPTIKVLCDRLDLKKQYAWMLWHGKVALSQDMMRRFHVELGIPFETLFEVERVIPAKKRGRPPKHPPTSLP